jgi:LPXTG-motif cell wall-anchored protein
MDLEVTVDGEKGKFTDIYYAITGIIRNPLYVGEIIPTNNEDGTVTFKFDLLAFDEEAEIVRKVDVKPERPCQPGYEDMEHCITKMEVKKSGPKTGLKKSDFAVIDEYGQVIGDILQAKEIAEGKYEVVWQHEAGEYEGLKLNTAAGYGDFYVCYFPKDDDGNYRVNESHLSEYEFKATITHTKDPIVIEHEEATLETAGATNIPKLVDLYFKEVTEEIDEDTMALYKKNAEDTAVKREIVHIYDISLLVGGVEIQPDGNVKITIPLSEKMKKYVDLKVVYFTETGEAKEVEAYEVTDTAISFITNHFSYYAVLGTPQEAIEETGEEETDGAVPESPKTGDSAIHYAFFIGIMALMGIGIVLKKEYGR